MKVIRVESNLFNSQENKESHKALLEIAKYALSTESERKKIWKPVLEF